jgi:NADH-quinone oxidoreductase subunit N
MFVFQNTFIFDALTSSIKQILLIATLVCLILSLNSIVSNQLNHFEYLILILSSVLGLMLLISSFDMLSLYLSIEMQSLCLYVLAASKKDSSFSMEAGLKYFIIGSFSSALLLFGISFIYLSTGTTNFTHIELLLFETIEESSLLNSSLEKGMLFLTGAFLFKVAAAPFHFWSPDVYEGSPLSSTIFFALVPKIALFTILVRLFQIVFLSFEISVHFSLCLFAICSVIFGSFTALSQKKLKRLLALSSTSHVGYLLLALSINSIEGVQSMFFYLLSYLVSSSCIWSIFIALTTFDNDLKSRTIADLSSLSAINPLLGLTAIFGIFSLASIPPLVGFLAKIDIFMNSLGAHSVFPSTFLLLSSVISCFYYIRLIKIAYFEKSESFSFVFSLSKYCSLFLGFSASSLLLLFINPSLLSFLSHKMALDLF